MPKLFKFDDESKTIWTEYCGISLNLKYEPKQRHRFKQQIRFLVSELQKIGLHHNDIRWKNVVESESGQLFLIDFECVSTDNKERDPEYILRDKL